MSDKARSSDSSRRLDARGRARTSRWTITAGFAAIFIVLVLIGNIAAPYLIAGATLEGAVANQLRAAAGLVFHTKVSGRFDLLPRPHLVFYETRVTNPSGTIDVSAEEFDGDVRLLPLIVGRVELSSITLVGPRMTIDLDGKPVQPESAIGRAMRPGEPAVTQALGVVTLVNGKTTLKSQRLRQPVEMSNVNMTLDWRDLEASATLTGSLSVRDTPADVALWVANPALLMRGARSSVTFNLHSNPLNFSAKGELASAATGTFNGRVSATAPSASHLLDLADIPATLIAPFANLSINGDAAVEIDADRTGSVDLQNLTLRADGNTYEGSLAFQEGTRPALTGTLATEQLALSPFLSRLPDLHDAQGAWSAERLIGAEPPKLDLDLRISATHVRLAPFTVDNAALGVMTRGDRTEIALVEGKAYGGTAKGRVSIGVSNNEVNLRGAGSLNGADASALTWDGFGRQLATGTFSASTNLESTGDSPAALMRNLQGWTKGSATDGEIIGIDFARILQARQSRDPIEAMSGMRTGRTAFDKLSFSARTAEGVATLDDGSIKTGPASVGVGGSADIGARTVDLKLAVSPSQAAGAAGRGSALEFSAQGPFGKVRLRPAGSIGRP